MSEIVDRVAKAISNYWFEHGFDASEPNEDLARAVIEAMRDPTEKMLERGDHGTSAAGWNAMIDAALE